MSADFVRPMGVQPPDDRPIRHRCSEQVWSSSTWRHHPCKRSATVQEHGKWWCKQHAPSAVGVRREERSKKWNENQEARERMWIRSGVRAATLRITSASFSELPRYGTTEHGIDRFDGGEYVKMADVLRLLEEG